jgi:maltose alpha-D-glucosyltransferase/alpha-amylase
MEAATEMEANAMIPTLSLAGDWETILVDKARAELERVMLPEYLRQQRWFGGKGRRIASIRMVDWGEWPTGRTRVFPLLMEVDFADGKSDLFFLPLGVTIDAPSGDLLPFRPPWAIAHLRGPQGPALLHDALADEETCLSLLSVIGMGREQPLRFGRILAVPTAAFPSLRGNASLSLPVRHGPAASSNTLILFGERLLLKVFRHLDWGIHPDAEIGRFLTEGHRFDRIPRMAGTLEYHRSGFQPITLAILQSFVVNQGDGWKHALEQLSRYYERVFALPHLEAEKRSLLDLAAAAPPPQFAEALGEYLHAAAVLGQRTAQLHRALSSDPDNPDFAPQPFTPRDAGAVRQSLCEQASGAFSALSDNLDRLPSDAISSARHLLANGIELARRVEHGVSDRVAATKIRCHGDYHLGQVLRVDNDYFLLDFEGEPARTLAQRRAKQSPLKDVAGMVRSFHYAAYAGLFAFTENRADAFAHLAPWAELWYQWVAAAFLRAYRNEAEGEPFWPSDDTTAARLLDAFMLDKAFYELNYELNNRPDWVRIPLRGILALMEKGSNL